MFKFIQKLFKPQQKPETVIDKTVRLLGEIPNTNSVKVYTSDLCNNVLTSFYGNIGIYIGTLKYILDCFEYHRPISSYYVSGKTKDVYLPAFFTVNGNYILEIDEVVKEFTDLAKTFLIVYQESENNLKDTENNITERNLQMTRQVVNDLVQLAGQLNTTLV